jgi:peptidoglycan/LPS O-acetylase OafA/YrhL
MRIWLPTRLREPMDPAAVALTRADTGDRTRTRNRSQIIDALRAIAALMVLADHTMLQLPGAVATAVSRILGVGLFIFFAVSGYLIAGPFLRALVRGDQLPRMGVYATRRAARIYPAYWIAFAAAALLIPPVSGIHPYQIPVHLLLLQSSWPHVGEPAAILGVAWTLGIEVAFYVFVPLAAVLLRALHPGRWSPDRLAMLVVGAGAASVAWTYFVIVHVGSSTSTPALFAQIGLQMWFFAFCPGMLIALATLAQEETGEWQWYRRLTKRSAVPLTAAALLWAGGYALERTNRPGLVATSTPMYVIACGLVVVCLVTAGSWIRRPAAVLAPVGLISYGMYLWHFIVIQFIWRHTSIGTYALGLHWLADVVLLVAITVLLATASWFGIERPLMRRAAKWASGRRSDQPESVQPPAPGPAELDLPPNRSGYQLG